MTANQSDTPSFEAPTSPDDKVPAWQHLPPPSTTPAPAHAPCAPSPYPTTIRYATINDYTYIDSLMQKHAHELGFLPTAALLANIIRNSVLLSLVNDQPAGFLLFAKHKNLSRRMKIYMHCIQPDARHQLHGLRLCMVCIALAYANGYNTVSLRCRDDLPSNLFWPAAGFQPFGTTPSGKTTARRIIHWFINPDNALASDWLPFREPAIAAMAVRYSRNTGNADNLACAAATACINAITSPYQGEPSPFPAAAAGTGEPAAASPGHAAAGILVPAHPKILATARDLPPWIAALGIPGTCYSGARRDILARATLSPPIPQPTLLHRQEFWQFVKDQTDAEGYLAVTAISALAGTPPPLVE